MSTTEIDTRTPTPPAARDGEGGGDRPAKKTTPARKPRPRAIGHPNDPVADLLTRVRNAAGARHETVSVPASRTKVEIAKILREEGFIAGFEQPSAREI